MSALSNASAAYATIPAQDLERARNFWEKTIGLTPSEITPAGVWYSFGAGKFLLFQSSGKASGDHTQLGFRVDDIEATVRDLSSNGVEFQQYDLPGLKTVDSIAEVAPGNRAAWFYDTEGNLFGVIHMAEVPVGAV